MYAQSTCAQPVPTWTIVEPSTFGWSARKVCIASKFAGHLIIVDTSAISSQMQCQTQHQTLPLACKQKQDSDRAHKSKVDLIPPLRGEYDNYGMSREQFVAKFATRRIHDSTNVLPAQQIQSYLIFKHTRRFMHPIHTGNQYEVLVQRPTTLALCLHFQRFWSVSRA
jgi:hypothetical protein